MGNSIGNDSRAIRKFLRERGVKPTIANIERVGREVRRTPQENERIVQMHKEIERARGLPSTTDQRGDVHARVKRRVQRDLEREEGR